MIYRKWWNFHRNFHSKLLKYQSVFQTSHSMEPILPKCPSVGNNKHWRSFVVRHALISSYIYVRKPARIWIEPCFLSLMESVFSVPWCFSRCLLCDFLCVNLSTGGSLTSYVFLHCVPHQSEPWPKPLLVISERHLVVVTIRKSLGVDSSVYPKHWDDDGFWLAFITLRKKRLNSPAKLSNG